MYSYTQINIAYLGQKFFLQIFEGEFLKNLLNFTAKANKMEIYLVSFENNTGALMTMLSDIEKNISDLRHA